MTRQSGPKPRREHLKNLRRIRKDKDITRKPAARKAAAEPGSLFTNLGLALIITVLVVLGGSAVLQNRLGSFDFVSSSLDPSGAGLPAIDPATIEVRVLNGCGAPGAGRRMTTRLRDLHFDV
ncbi:MAG: LytR C-terminal domain-containing protein, partial [Candidatus Glassbacteria bacterium]|nr:LytR C-terminal domain-containing protein [Candidatus Glassbacteria bacterium]